MKESLDKILKENAIQFKTEEAEAMFLSHMESFWQRIKENTYLEEDESMYADVLSEIDEESLRIAREIVEPSFQAIEEEVSFMELVLVATHIQVNKG